MEAPMLQTQFNQFPLQIQEKVFSYLSPESRQPLKCVCSQWKKILDEIPVAVINNQNFERTTKLTAAVFVKVRNFTTEFQQGLMFKRTIRRLDWWDVVVSYNLVHFLQECCSFVQELNFGNVTLDSHRKMSCPEGLTLPEVKTITFNLKRYTRLTEHELILCNFLRQIQFGKLEEVKILTKHYQNPPVYDHRDYRIEIRGPTIKMELPSAIRHNELLALLMANRETIKKFVARGRNNLRIFGSPNDEFKDEIDYLQLEVINCNIIEGVEFAGSESLIIECQRSLKQLSVAVEQHCWPTVAKAILASFSTLVDVEISIDYWTHRDPNYNIHFDASTFKDCANLQSLTWWVGNSIASLTSLPKCIQRLELEAIFTPDDLLGIAALSNLKNCKLYPISVNLEALSVSEEVIQAFVRNETLEILTLDGCKVDQTTISNLANSQDRFKINFLVYPFQLGQEIGTLTISKTLTSSEPEPPAQ